MATITATYNPIGRTKISKSCTITVKNPDVAVTRGCVVAMGATATQIAEFR
jgi:hypothetical protein